MSIQNDTFNITGKDWFSYIGYTIQGLILVILNALVIGINLRYSNIRKRKDCFILGSLALADFLRGLGYFLAGSYRLYLMITEQAGELKTAWECLLTAHNLVFIFGEPSAATMLLCVSVDRLVTVAFPVKYFESTVKYSYFFVSIFFSFATAVAFGVVAVSFLEPDIAKYRSFCFTGWAMGDSPYQNFYQYTQITCYALSVVVYLLIPIVYYQKKSEILPEALRNIPSEVARQKDLVVTMGISTFFTFLFSLMPRGLSTFIRWQYRETMNPTFYGFIVSSLGLVENINPMCNFWLYFIRHQEFRYALKSFLKGQNWNPNPTIPNSKVAKVVKYNRVQNRVSIAEFGPSSIGNFEHSRHVQAHRSLTPIS